jgi:hypothetical protein
MSEHRRSFLTRVGLGAVSAGIATSTTADACLFGGRRRQKIWQREAVVPCQQILTQSTSPTLIASWPGNDPRFYHRDGGEPFQNTAWMDHFTTIAPGDWVCQMAHSEDFIPLPRGDYQLIWWVHLLFAVPPCQRARPGGGLNPIMSFIGTPFGGSEPKPNPYFVNEYDICNNLHDNTYTDGINYIFHLYEPNTLSFHLNVISDLQTNRPYDLNITLAIVYSMNLYKF